ncbi:hypothetical protein [Bremerella sp. P1]|uniref:hypothetical protein n=1 Tax=Bremerella sp. P1 TaxID=3026424 RepID=UPI00236827C5|nr:hypothetical protein [Bremerella sp. P1]WDI44864.1 hypothetical protein PSR63_13055 [Bremerella sp. P1]
MESSKRFPWWVLITAQGLCAAGLLAGIFCLVSPFWFSAGVYGLIEGYDRQTDVLGIVWLAGSLGSMLIGVILIGASGLTAIWTGIAVGIGGLAMKKIPPKTDPEEAPADQAEET